MKLILLFGITLMGIVGFTSTKKQATVPVAAPKISGEWQGHYCLEGGPSINPLTFEFGPYEQLAVCDGPKEWGDRAKGYFTLANDTLTASYKYKDGIQDNVTIKAFYNGQTHRLEGTWKWIKGQGTFVLDKKS